MRAWKSTATSAWRSTRRGCSTLRAGDAYALFFLGLVALKQARWREAMESLRSAAEKGGNRPAVLHNLGFAYEQLGRLDEAEAACAEAASRARNDPRIYLGWGIVALKRGDHAGASGRLDRARELYGSHQPPAIWYRARALAAGPGSDFETAEQIGGMGIAAYPSNAVLRNNLAVLRELSGDLRGAEELVRMAIRDEPVMRVEVVVPKEHMGDVIGNLSGRRGQIQSQEDRGGTQIVNARVPLSEMFGYSTDLRSRTQGRATYSMHFDRYEPAPGNVSEEVVARVQGK